MATRGGIITRTFEQGGKKIIVQTDSEEYMREQAKIYSKDKE